MRPLAATLSERSYVDRLGALTDLAIIELLRLHPMHVVRAADDYQIVAGFRSYQLATSRPAVVDKIPVIEYTNLLDEDALVLARIDILGSVVMHSLGSKSAEQLGMITQNLGMKATESIAPSLKSVRARRKFEQGQ